MKLRTLLVLLALALVIAAGCRPSPKQRALSADQIGSAYARLSAYMQGRGGETYQEDTPSNIRHSVILDEAVLASIGGSESCFEATIRTASGYDEPLDQLSPRCTIDGMEHDAIVRDETLTVVDYSFTGHENVVVAEGVAVGEYLGLQISKPTEKIFRVIERNATLCCPATPERQIGLEMYNARMGVNNDYGVAFVWNLQ